MAYQCTFLERQIPSLSLTEQALNAAYMQGLKAVSEALKEGREVQHVVFKWGRLERLAGPSL